MKARRIKIPAGLTFDELRLRIDPRTNRMKYRPEILAPLLRANNLQLQTLFGLDDVAEEVIGEWYHIHLATGGEPSPLAERLFHHRRGR
jgi:hypothetical protein